MLTSPIVEMKNAVLVWVEMTRTNMFNTFMLKYTFIHKIYTNKILIYIKETMELTLNILLSLFLS